MKHLERLNLGDYSIDEAKKLDEINETDIIPLEKVLEKFPSVEVKDYLVPLVKNGITLDNR